MSRAVEYRVCVADTPGLTEDVSHVVASEEEARAILAIWLSKDYAEPPYEIGWVERRPCVAWERIA